MLRRIGLVKVAVFMLLIGLIGCNSKDTTNKQQERDYQRKLAEAQQLARKIREGDLFNESQIRQKRIRTPDNVCAFTCNYHSIDWGPEPEFRGDGRAAIYNDKSGIVYYYDVESRQRYKMWQYGQHPSFGMRLSDGNQKFIFQEYEIKRADGGNVVEIKGIRMNTDNDWLKPPKSLYEGNAEHPYLVSEDKNVIFIEDGQHYLLDSQLIKNPISEEEFIQLRDNRFPHENKWKVVQEYKGIQGVWVTDLAELNWVQLRNTKQLRTLKIMPVHYSLYCWGDEFAGMLEIVPTDLPNYSIALGENMKASPGDLFDIYEKKLSPISQEVIGYQEDQYKGTLRVLRIVEGHLVCEFQTKVFQSGIFKDDAAVSQKNPQVIGKIL